MPVPFPTIFKKHLPSFQHLNSKTPRQPDARELSSHQEAICAAAMKISSPSRRRLDPKWVRFAFVLPAPATSGKAPAGPANRHIPRHFREIGFVPSFFRAPLKWVRFAFLFAVAASLFAQDDPAHRIDEIFSQWNKISTPGASVAVIRAGKLVYQKGYGAANL